MDQLHLIPEPRSLKKREGGLSLSGGVHVLLQPHAQVRDLFAAERFAAEASSLTGIPFHVAVTEVSVNPTREIHVQYDAQAGGGNEQGYRLTISKAGIVIAAPSRAGTFYAFQTLTQIVRGAALGKLSRSRKSLRLPCLEIEDYPDLERRGVYHDCARGKIPTVETLLQLIDDLGHLKYNEFQLYIENGFEFRKHPEMYDDTTPFTAEEMLLLDAACRVRHMDFVPSLTSLGHFEKILSRPAFRHLAEVEPEELKKAGVATWSEQPWTLCVTDPAAREFLKEMYAEFVPNFSSGMFNICCDESWDLGKGRSKEVLEKIGPGRMYVEWVNYCAGLARDLGKRIQMWGDIILNHPELIGELPGDATLLEWGYESHHKFDEHLKVFAERIGGGNASERRFYVAPGTASWLSFASRTRNALGNIYRGVAAGIKHGAKGMLLTDWGDNGHQQMLGVSLLAFGYGAAVGWNLKSVADPSIDDAPNWDSGIVPAGSEKADIALQPFLQAASIQLFGDTAAGGAAEFASLAYELGLTYERFGWQRFNGSLEWFLFREKWDFANYVNRTTATDLRRVIAACERLKKRFERAELHGAGAGGGAGGRQAKAEFVFTCDEIIHTCRRTRLRQLWLAADPAKRNPEHEVLRAKKPVGLRKTFRTEMKKLRKDAKRLEKEYVRLWRKRNKESRLEDVRAEFQRLRREYKEFA